MHYDVTSPGEALAGLDRRAKRRQAERMKAAGIQAPRFEDVLEAVRRMDHPFEASRQVMVGERLAEEPLARAPARVDHRKTVPVPVSGGIPVADLLRTMLEGGPRDASEVRRECELAGISWRSTESARKKLGIRAQRVGFGSGGKWVLTLPPSSGGHAAS